MVQEIVLPRYCVALLWQILQGHVDTPRVDHRLVENITSDQHGALVTALILGQLLERTDLRRFPAGFCTTGYRDHVPEVQVGHSQSYNGR